LLIFDLLIGQGKAVLIFNQKSTIKNQQ